VLSPLRLPLRFDPVPLRREVDALEPDDWVPHFNTSCYEGDWSGAALRSVGGVATQLYPDPATTLPFADTPLAARCPHMMAAVGSFHCPLMAVRLLRLGPGSRILEHRDHNLGYDDGEVRIHVPVSTNPLVAFRLDNDTVDMEPGEAWYLDLNLPHAVDNSGHTPRVHLVVDCVVDPWMRSLLRAAATTAQG
jgi:hypothetical protein